MNTPGMGLKSKNRGEKVALENCGVKFEFRENE